MNLDIGEGKSVQSARDGSVSIYSDSNIVFLKPLEAEKFKRWLIEVI
jgi:hypothetical protein